MAFGDDLVALAKAHIGERYRLGARARFLDPDFKGPWDCAEFISWVIYQASGGRTLLGCKPRDAARAEAYTGFWVDDAKKYGLIVSIDNALRTVGAALLRAPAKKRIGHIAFSLGDGRGTVEAHSAKYGVIRGNADPKKRGWEYGVRIPAPAQWKTLTAEASDPDAWFFRPTFAPTVDPRVEAIQTALDKKGFDTPVSGHYTEALASTVADFQEAKKLVVDGMVGKQTLKALRLDWSSKTAPSGVYNDRYGVFFDTLTSGGFFSHDPDDLGVKRSIRTNNPGALNFSAWQKSLPGYVAVTPPITARTGIARRFIERPSTASRHGSFFCRIATASAREVSSPSLSSRENMPGATRRRKPSTLMSGGGRRLQVESLMQRPRSGRAA